MAPRKKKATTVELTFSEPRTGVELPSKTPKGEFYRRLEALKVGEMIEIAGTTLKDARSTAKKVMKDYEGRTYEIRAIDPDNAGSAIGVWRMGKQGKAKAAATSDVNEPQI